MVDNPNTDPKNDHPDSYATQLLLASVAFVAIGIVVALLAKVFVGVLLVLLGMVLGGGSRYAKK